MPQDELRESIEKLRLEIESLDPGDQSSKERLESLVSELERNLSDSDTEQHETLVQSLREGIEHFEVEHPSITGVLNHIMVTLSNMGI